VKDVLFDGSHRNRALHTLFNPHELFHVISILALNKKNKFIADVHVDANF